MNRRNVLGTIVCASGAYGRTASMKPLCSYPDSLIQAIAPNDSTLVLCAKRRPSFPSNKDASANSIVQIGSLKGTCSVSELQITGSYFDAAFSSSGEQLTIVNTKLSPLTQELWRMDVGSQAAKKIADLNLEGVTHRFPMRNGRILSFINHKNKSPAPIRLTIEDHNEVAKWPRQGLEVEVGEGEVALAKGCLSADTRIVAYPMDRHRIGVRETDQLRLLWEARPDPELMLREISISADSQFVLVSLVDSQLMERVRRHVLRVYSVADGKPVWELEAPQADIIAVAPGGYRFAIGRRKADRFGMLSQLVELYERGEVKPIAETVVRSIWRPKTIIETLYQRLAFASKGNVLVVTARDTKTYEI